jgi:hypothetical protein
MQMPYIHFTGTLIYEYIYTDRGLQFSKVDGIQIEIEWYLQKITFTFWTMLENVPSYFVNICMQNSLKVIIWPLKNIPKNFIIQNFIMIPNFKKCRILWWFQICSHGFKIWPKKVTSTCKNNAKSIESEKSQNLYKKHIFLRPRQQMESAENRRF